MEWAALITWVLTALGGFFLLSFWISAGGLQQRAEGWGRIRPLLVFTHLSLAGLGLVLWIVYVATDNEALAWIAFLILLVVAGLGWTMFAIWYRQRQHRPLSPGDAVASAPGPTVEGGSAELRFPVSVVALHGLLAVVTLVLVLIAAAAD
jgi:uncharacterized membrane protein SirB2